MRKILSFFAAILFAGSMMAADPVAAGTTLFSEDFSGYAKDAVPSGTVTTATGRVVYGDASVTYTSADNGKNITKIYTEALASGTSPELLVGKSGGVFTVAGIPSGNAKEITVSFKQNAQKLTVSLAGNGYSTEYASPKPAAAGQITFDVTVADGADATFSIIMTAGSSNVRVDDILVTVKTAGESSGGEDPQPTTKTIYLNGGGSSLWNQADPEFFVHSWGGAADGDVHMTLVEGDVYKADIPADNTDLLFLRLATGTTEIVWSGEAHWNQSANQTIPEGKDLFTMTSWDNGTWSVYGEGGDTPEPPAPVEAAYYLVGTMNSWQAAEAYKFAAAETEGEFILHTTLAENDEIKVIKVEGETTTWYPAEGGNYIVDALHAGEKDIYFRPAGNEAWADFGGYIWMGENQPAPVADFTQPFTLKFNGTGESGKDASAVFAADVAAIFDAASAPYVASVEEATKVYAGRPISDDNSSVKFGTTSAQGTLAFTLAQTIEVDSIIVNATQYGNNAAKVTVNGTEFDLTAGNKKPQDCKITPENAVSAITIAQSGSERIYLRNVRVYPKTQGGDTPVEIVLPVVKLAGSLTSWEEPVLMANAEDSLSASVTIALEAQTYEFKVVSDGKWLSLNGEGETLYGIHREWNKVEHINGIDLRNFELTADVAGDYTFTWTYADSTLLVTFPDAPAQPKFYITGNEDIVGEGNPTWGKNGALESFSDTLVMNLAAGFHKFKLITPAEQWLGMEALTDTAYGLFTDDDTNICFNIAEAGEVTVIYNATEFKVEGDFYIAPVANYYLIGDSAFVVDAGATADKAWTPDAIASFKDTTVLNLKAGVDYIMRLSLNGTWENHRDFRHLTDTAAGLKELVDEYENHSIGFQLAEAGQVTVIYIPAANEQPEVFKLIGNFYVAPAPDPTVAVRGSMNDWGDEIPFVLSDDKTYASLTVENISADTYEFKFIINGEYRSNGYRFHRGFPGVAGISGNEDADMTFEADQDGEYTIQWYFANDSLAIIFPEYIEPAKEYYAKYAPAWEWVKLTEAEGLWLTDTIVYGGIGININDKADDENNMFYSNTVEEEGVRPIAGAEFDVNDTLLFSFNPADSVVTAIMVGKYVPQLPVVGLGANFNGWNWPENLFVPAEDSLSASFKITLAVTDTIEFKIVSDGSWLSLNGEGESLYGLHRNWPKAEHVNIINDGRNFSLTTDVAGEYIFTWTYADSTLVVTFPAAPVDPTEHTYTVAGGSADLFGTTWEPANTANDMALVEGLYTWEKTELTLAAGSIGFKVCEDHAWATAYPAQDYQLNIPEAGIYTITITFNPETKAVDAVATKTGDAEVTVNYYLVGSVKGWEAKAENIFTLNAEAGEGIEEYMIETTLAVGEGLKVVSSTGAWYPEGTGNEYVVDQNHAGATTIYFRPAYNEEWAAFGGYMYVVPTDPTALDEIMAAGKAVKIVRNGQILIIKGEKIFNAQGQLVK